MDYKLKTSFLTPEQAKSFLARFEYIDNKYNDYQIFTRTAGGGLKVDTLGVRQAIRDTKINTGNLGNIFNTIFNPGQLAKRELEAVKELKLGLNKAIGFKIINTVMSDVFNRQADKLNSKNPTPLSSQEFLREVRLGVSALQKANPQYFEGGQARTIMQFVQSNKFPQNARSSDIRLWRTLQDDFTANYTAYADLARNISGAAGVRTEAGEVEDYSPAGATATATGGRTPAQIEADRIRAEEDEKDRQDNIAKYREAIRRIVAERDNSYFAYQLSQDQVKQSYEATKTTIAQAQELIREQKNVSEADLAEDYQASIGQLNQDYEQTLSGISGNVRQQLSSSQAAFRRAGSRGSASVLAPDYITQEGLGQADQARGDYESETTELARITDRKAREIEQAFLSGRTANYNALGEANINLQNVLAENEARYNLDLIDALNRQRDAVVEEDRLLTGSTLEQAYDKTSGYLFDTDKLQKKANTLAGQRRSFTPEQTPTATNRRGYHSRARDKFQKRRLGNRSREKYQTLY